MATFYISEVNPTDMDSRNETEAYNAGARGQYYNTNNISEKKAYDQGRHDRITAPMREELARNITMAGFGIFELIIKPVLLFSPFFFIAYKIATSLFHKTYSYYWKLDAGETMGGFVRLSVTTVIITYFLLCISYYFRGKMIYMKSTKDDKWKLINSFIIAFHIVGPILILLILLNSIGSGSGNSAGGWTIMIITFVFCAVIMKLYKEHKVENKDEYVQDMFMWSYNWGFTGVLKYDKALPFKISIISLVFYFVFYR